MIPRRRAEFSYGHVRAQSFVERSGCMQSRLLGADVSFTARVGGARRSFPECLRSLPSAAQLHIIKLHNVVERHDLSAPLRGKPAAVRSGSQTTMKLAVAILVLIAVPALAAELPPDLAKAVNDYDRAQIDNDIPTLKRLVAADYVLVNSNATVENKQQFLADFRLPGFKIDPYVMQQPFEKVWGNAAVIGGLVNLSWTQDGKHQTRLLRIAYVWAKRNGHWQATYTQVTRVPRKSQSSRKRRS